MLKHRDPTGRGRPSEVCLIHLFEVDLLVLVFWGEDGAPFITWQSGEKPKTAAGLRHLGAQYLGIAIP